MRNQTILAILAALLLGACGRPSEDADVKFVGVGMDPDEIGPDPMPYGGTVEYDHVDFASGGLALGLMGLMSTEGIGPKLADFAPPYEAVMGFSYVFDQKLSAASSLVTIGGAPPVVEGTCYTTYDPQGPIGSFATVDVGDYIEFTTAAGDGGFRMNRSPVDYPPDPQDIFIYYIGFQYYTPTSALHWVPDPTGDADPRSMQARTYRQRNFPFGEEVSFRFPGGFARQDEPVASIPRPSLENTLTIPDELSGVMLEWNGRRYDAEGNVIGTGPQKRCFEFYEGRTDDPSLSLDDCDVLPTLPTAIDEYDSFLGQMYTAPWDTADGDLTLHWHPKENGDTVSLSVRFMAPIDPTDPNYAWQAVQMDNGEYRPAYACEDPEDIEYPFDDAGLTNPDGSYKTSAMGDSFSQLINVNCLLPDTGEFTITEEIFEDALTYAKAHDVGGVVFFLSRGNEIDAEVPAVKDQYDQRHDITPIKVAAKTTRVGRFWWDGPTVAEEEE